MISAKAYGVRWPLTVTHRSASACGSNTGSHRLSLWQCFPNFYFSFQRCSSFFQSICCICSEYIILNSWEQHLQWVIANAKGKSQQALLHCICIHCATLSQTHPCLKIFRIIQQALLWNLDIFYWLLLDVACVNPPKPQLILLMSYAQCEYCNREKRESTKQIPSAKLLYLQLFFGLNIQLSSTLIMLRPFSRQ